MLHLHPVLGIVVLAIAEHYFGIWGLLLAYPVTVFLIARALGREDSHRVTSDAIGAKADLGPGRPGAATATP